MQRVKWVIRILLFVILGAFLHYILPQRDIARVTNVEIIPNFETGFPIFFSQQDSGTVAQPTRSLKLISSVRKRTYLLGLVRGGDQTMVYRNEDTGWIWPPYFKFDSLDLQSEAIDLKSDAAAPIWVVITHYGWRSQLLTIFPNAISIRQVSGPDVMLIPYFNIGFFVLMGVVFFFLRTMWRQFRERSVDPALETASDQWDKVEAGVSERRGRLGRWFDSWKAKPRR